VTAQQRMIDRTQEPCGLSGCGRRRLRFGREPRLAGASARYRPQQVLRRHVTFEGNLVEQRVLLDLPLPHHRLPPAVAMRDYAAFAKRFFNIR
jgi:hypothetical protein